MSAPSVTVCIPVYNGAEYLDEAITSMRRQSLEAIEIIVVDDGSTDGSLAIAQRHAAADRRVRVVRQPHGGVAAARNRCLVDATSEFVAFLDADDVALPSRLERQLTFLSARRDVKALGTYGWRMGESGRVLGVFDVGPRDVSHFERIKAAGEPIYLLTPSVMVSRIAALECGGFRPVPAAEDIDLWTRMGDRHLVLVLPERLLRYRVRTGSLSSRHFKLQMYATELVTQNARHRRRGEPETDLRSVIRVMERQPTIVRARRKLTWFSQRSYRIAGSLLANGDPRGIGWLACAIAVQPTVPAGRLVDQVVPLIRERLGSVRLR